MKPGAISRRITSCLKLYSDRKYEESLINLFPALDQTAKKRRSVGVGQRFREFLSDQEDIIFCLATRQIHKGMKIDGKSFPEAIYDFARNPLMHEGELDPRLAFSFERPIQAGVVWNLPPPFILTICTSVIIAPENKDEHSELKAKISIIDTEHPLNELWGQEEMVRSKIKKIFNN